MIFISSVYAIKSFFNFLSFLDFCHLKVIQVMIENDPRRPDTHSYFG